jgi:hypothetical protein
MDDRYRGIFGRRDVVFVHAADLDRDNCARSPIIVIWYYYTVGGYLEILHGYP